MLQFVLGSAKRKFQGYWECGNCPLKTLTLGFLCPRKELVECQSRELFSRCYVAVPNSSSPSLSIWRRKKEMSKEGLLVVREMKRLEKNSIRLERFMSMHVSRLLRSDLVTVLVEFQRQDQIFLGMRIYDVIQKEIWYRPDMYFYRDMLFMLARNKRVDESRCVWQDLKKEQVHFDQHTYGDVVRAFLDGGLVSQAMDIYADMRQSSDPPMSLPFRVILKGLLPYPDLREKLKKDFLDLFPDMIVFDPPEDLFHVDTEDKTDSDD